MIKDNQTNPNLSEQYLLSCNTDGWNCIDGGWWAHDYHIWKIPPGESQAGAVLESGFPYVAWDALCSPPHDHPYRLTDWAYVGDGYSIPSANAIKQAIYNYGPVATAICASGPVFQGYHDGIYATNESSYCDGGTDHAIVLVGWNDTENTWILRNSWDSGWGESGYMRIARNVSNVGYAANYVIYNNSQCYTLTTNVSPTGSGSVSRNAEPNCNGTQYTAGTNVTLTANSNPGYIFSNWSGDASGSTNPKTVTMDGDKNVTANFVVGSLYRYYFPLVLADNSSIPGWTTIVSENFEGSFPGSWNVLDNDGTTNGEYYWGKRGCKPYAGSYSGWGVGAGAQGSWLNCGNNYPDNTDSWMVYGPFSLVGATAADMKYKLWLNSESSYDYVCRLASTDGSNFSGWCTSGYTDWTDRVLDLANVPNLGNLLGQLNVWVALQFYSDEIYNYAEGGYVDNIVLRKCTSASCPVGVSAPLPANSRLVETPARKVLPRR
jgi:uncharacterized repeat protein (TIGR02543 family)